MSSGRAHGLRNSAGLFAASGPDADHDGLHYGGSCNISSREHDWPANPSHPHGYGTGKAFGSYGESFQDCAQSPDVRGVQEVAKSHLKQKSPEGRSKPSRDKEKETVDAVIIEDDKASTSLL